ncbi:BZ3500_MvSof-1268-A1-R1_Chr11-2g03446 [Microbotryum saponariae]|uniref:MICOS complex subunit MIC10 n=1 Tax=Microbotryum saponariae TaxID=289078 RepID=A0A2X0LEA3_9BASI|nr:BZ3500_MvSof-1268-A1-R1_Chr11-2g03446 [Microbotryum saponariae]SDA03390.1 BZ3501_MvSof-1269-A2-R1_Chr11g03017 [Microbotryum saponariae]
MSSAPAPSNKTSSAVPSEDVLSAKASARRGISRTSGRILMPLLALVTLPLTDVLLFISRRTSDICVSNAIVKAGIGFGAGVVCSAILFRRRPWPVLVGLGFGLGQGYSDCERVFNPAAVPGFVIATDGKPEASPYANFNPFGSKASEVKDKAEDKVSQVVDKVKDATKQVVGKAEAVKDKAENKLGDKKWV